MNRPSRDEWVFGLLDQISTRSEDPDTKVGCVILDKEGRVASVGYNGLPRGLSEKEFSMKRPEKYNHVVHADMNAILSAERYKLKGSTMYIPFPPCCECSKAIIQSGISRVIYERDYTIKDKNNSQALGSKMLEAAGVFLIKWRGKNE